ncbi:MAG TPA: hypothetical protein VFT22_28270 [Kofleriaceae bacterium]|nr:hypothetical protein [Kofleriaceae bacterium]
MTAPNLSVLSEPDRAVSSPPSSGSPPSPGIDDPVPAEVRAVIDLYANQLAKVSFPEIDAASLRRQADELRAEARVVARARDALEAQLASLAARKAVLAETAARAVAYARIYSEAHPDRAALASAIAALSRPPPPAPEAGALPPGKRRGRPPRRGAELFDAPTPPPAVDGAPVGSDG